VLWTALPWGVVLILAYSSPDFSTVGKIVYACVTNILLMTLYSANNTPYSAMTGVMTADINERTRLSSYRFVSAMVAQFIVGGFTLPLVAKFGQGNNAKGWQMTMALWASVCVVLFLITFLTTRERIQPDPRQKSSPRQDFRDLFRNGPWICMFILTLAHFIMLAMRGGTIFFYFNYYVDKSRLFDILQGLGLTTAADGAIRGGLGHYLLNTFGLVVDGQRSNVASVGFSLFNMSSQIITVVGVLFSAMLSIRFGKRAVALVCFSLTAVFMSLFILLPPDAIGTTFVLEYVRALAYAPTIPLLWAMFADVVDYAEWKTGRRTTGIVYATVLFGLKAGLSLGGAIAGWLLSGYGYQAHAAQTTETLLGIRMTISVYPAVFLCIVVACLSLYKIDKKMNLEIQNELMERRKKFQYA
jgi:Na+/melibiose symporter-like transporter